MNTSVQLVEVHTDSVRPSAYLGGDTISSSRLGHGLEKVEKDGIPVLGYCLIGNGGTEMSDIAIPEGPYTNRIMIHKGGGLIDEENAQLVAESLQTTPHMLFVGGYWGACLSNTMGLISNQLAQQVEINSVYFHLVKPLTGTGESIDLLDPNEHATNFMCWTGFRGNNIRCFIKNEEVEDRQNINPENATTINLMIWETLDELKNFLTGIKVEN